MPAILALLVMPGAASCTTAHSVDDSLDWVLPSSMEREESEQEERLLFFRNPKTLEEGSLFRLPHAYPEALWKAVVESHFGLSLGEEVPGPEDLPGRFFLRNRSDEARGQVFVTRQGEATLVAFVDDPSRLRRLVVRGGFDGAMDEDLRLIEGLGAESAVELMPEGAQGGPRVGRRVEVSFPSRLSQGYLLAEPLTRRTDAQDYVRRIVERGHRSLDEFSLEAWDSCSCMVARGAEVILAARLEDSEAFHLWIQGPALDPMQIQEERLTWVQEFLADPEAFVPAEVRGDR